MVSFTMRIFYLLVLIKNTKCIIFLKIELIIYNNNNVYDKKYLIIWNQLNHLKLIKKQDLV